MINQSAYTHDESLAMLEAFRNLATTYVALQSKTNAGEDIGELRAKFLQNNRIYEDKVPPAMRDQLLSFFPDLERILKE